MDKDVPSDSNVSRGKGYGNYYCPTCSKPRENQEFPLSDGFETYSCLICKQILAFGYILSLRMKCPKCGSLVSIG